jgi:hypothetical protein
MPFQLFDKSNHNSFLSSIPDQAAGTKPPGCETTFFKLGDNACIQAKAELAFRTPRRFAFRADSRGADRSWSAGATAPLSCSRPPFCPETDTPTLRSSLKMQTNRRILSHARPARKGLLAGVGWFKSSARASTSIQAAGFPF